MKTSLVEQVYPRIFRIEVPLPENTPRNINSCVIHGDGRFLIIDTGMKREACREALNAGLQELGVDLDLSPVCAN